MPRVRRPACVALSLAVVPAAALAAACAGRPPRPAGAAPNASPNPSPGLGATALDSLVVERGPCFGRCAVYRVVLARGGALTVARGGRVRQDTLPAGDAQALLARAVAAGVFTLPARILGDPALCPVPATDHATVVLTAYAPGRAARVEHYTGCYASAQPLALAPAVARLTAVEAAVDALARARNPG